MESCRPEAARQTYTSYPRLPQRTLSNKPSLARPPFRGSPHSGAAGTGPSQATTLRPHSGTSGAQRAPTGYGHQATVDAVVLANEMRRPASPPNQAHNIGQRSGRPPLPARRNDRQHHPNQAHTSVQIRARSPPHWWKKTDTNGERTTEIPLRGASTPRGSTCRRSHRPCPSPYSASATRISGAKT